MKNCYYFDMHLFNNSLHGGKPFVSDTSENSLFYQPSLVSRKGFSYLMKTVSAFFIKKPKKYLSITLFNLAGGITWDISRNLINFTLDARFRQSLWLCCLQLLAKFNTWSVSIWWGSPPSPSPHCCWVHHWSLCCTHVSPALQWQ